MNGTIHEKGLLIPIYKFIYLPVLEELKEYGISFLEETIALN
jgi:hypothetical protein